jgi:hypothetical protein
VEPAAATPAGADSPTEEESAAGEADDKNWWEEGWQEILAQVQQDSHNLHEFLAYAEVCDETEAYWQDAAAAGDVVALAYKAIAATVDGLPISPIAAYVEKVVNDLLPLGLGLGLGLGIRPVELVKGFVCHPAHTAASPHGLRRQACGKSV